MAEQNIVLTGFMGTGKTSIGREVAARLGRTFVDLDEVIVKRAGKTIAAIFEQEGEAGFRAREAEACAEVNLPAGLVVAAGGGAVVDPANREALAGGGVLVCLDADTDTIVSRLAGQDGRPMLAGADRRTRIAELLAQRSGAYEAIPTHLDTSHLSVEAAAERVMGIAAGLPEGAHRIPVKDEGGLMKDEANFILHPSSFILYDVLIAEGLLAQAGQRVAEAGMHPGRCAIVTNPTIAAHYAEPLKKALEEAGFEPKVYEIPEGEQHKTLATAAALYERFAADRLARGEAVIALGGGVVGDVAGFAAATWLRGVPFVQVPTSLLAMVDASIGGKAGVDLPAGKNLVGAFKQPELVLIDTAVLNTLPGAEFRSGLAEVLKAAVIGAPALFEQLAGSGPASLISMIADSARVKIRLVERDPFESGDRAWLNLGHTFGHALELYSGYRLRHGEGVALGMIAAAELGARLGCCEPGLARRLRNVIERLGLPTKYAFGSDEVRALMGTDKKRAGRSLRFVLPVKIGEVRVVEGVPEEKVQEALASIRQAQKQ